MTVLRCVLSAAAAIVAPCVSDKAAAQSSGGPATLPDIVVTASRAPESTERTGSAITVVHQTEITRSNPTTLVDALRNVPGLDISETGGPGATTSVRLRGANPGQTLVMIDGVRINDPSSASGDYDFSMFPAGAIERVEVLRGPQSALYGSDAIGGVINIITKRGSGPAQFNMQTEAGSYGTLTTSGSLLGSSGPWSYAFTGAGQRSDGFSRYGYRIPAIEARFPNLERDGFERWSGSARIGYDAGQGVRLEAGALSTTTRADYDAATGAFPDTPASVRKSLDQVWGRAAIDTSAMTHNLHVFANRTERSFNDVTYKTNTLPQNTTSTITDFIGERVGGEYQGNLKLGSFGSLIAGTKYETETANTFATNLLPVARSRRPTLTASQDTRSIFALWQLPVGDRLTLTFGSRVDDVVDVDRFATWRTTAAYLIPETGTKLRGSAGTGGKAPTLFQLYDPTFGNPTLQPETSFGWDAGIDQSLLNGIMQLSATVFGNRFNNLIEFTGTATAGQYINVARAETSGVELAGDVEVWTGLMKIKTAYTFLHAVDLRTGLTLQRRPAHLGKVTVAITPTPEWLIEPRLTLVSGRFSGTNETSWLAPYTRFDLYTEYRIDRNWRAFARMDNVTNTRYQEVLNYGTTGRAVYGGFNTTW